MDILQAHSIPDWCVVLLFGTMVVFMFLGGNAARKYGILDGAFNQSLPEVREILDKHRQRPETDAQLMRAALAELAYAPSAMCNKMPDWYARHAVILSKISAEIDEYVQSRRSAPPPHDE